MDFKIWKMDYVELDRLDPNPIQPVRCSPLDGAMGANFGNPKQKPLSNYQTIEHYPFTSSCPFTVKLAFGTTQFLCIAFSW